MFNKYNVFHVQVMELVKSGDIGQTVIQMLWERFTMKIPNTSPDESRAAVQLISMVAGYVALWDTHT